MTQALLLLLLAGPVQDEVYLEELTILSGYALGDELEFQGEDLEVIPVALHLGWDLNPWIGLDSDGGHLQLGIEPFINVIVEPERDIEIGVDISFRWRQPLSDVFSVYLEIGAGPMYFGLDTREQGNAGFQFLDQAGLGLQIFFGEKRAIQIGYRWRHVSHAGLRDERNSGIDANTVVVGVSFFY